jgi:hypothetical protein
MDPNNQKRQAIADLERPAGEGLRPQRYAREFDRSKATRRIDLESAVRAAGREKSPVGLRAVVARDNVVESPAGRLRRRNSPPQRVLRIEIELLGLDSSQQPFD